MQEFDVVVIGGGATGAGVARDAAMRGFKTLLIERGEIALLLKEGEKMIKDFSNQTLLYTYAGVRPLFREKSPPVQAVNITVYFIAARDTQLMTLSQPKNVFKKILFSKKLPAGRLTIQAV